MTPNALENLARWNLQIVVLAVTATVLVSLLRVNAPVIRHTFWRVLLLACLALPIVQPWRVTTIDTTGRPTVDNIPALSSSMTDAASMAGQSSVLARASRHARAHWVSYAVIALLSGALVRLIWLFIGIVRLQRLRRTGEADGVEGHYQELTSLIEAGAEIRRVDRLGQPVTFGVLKPAVLLPRAFSALPFDIQRAVLAHELWHVRRRDWAWVLVEEMLRAAFWFNPAMSWLISRVQSSREEVVDELTLQLTHDKKNYLEALLAFADEPTLFPATPFARRRHLFHRMLLISREAVMSSRRIVASSISMAVVVLTTGLYASTALPLKTVSAPVVAAQQNPPPRDRRPGEAGPETAAERDLKQAIEANPNNAELYYKVAALQEARGAIDAAEGTLLALKRAAPATQNLANTIAKFYARTGRFERGAEVLEEAAAVDTSKADGYMTLASYYIQKATTDQALLPADKLRYVDLGIASTDRAIEADPSASALKGIALRMKSSLVTDPAARQALIAQGDAILKQAKERKEAASRDSMVFVPAGNQSALPPVPSGQAVRIGGDIKPPAKIKDVRPVYPPVALDAKIQGVVVMEITVDEAGNVSTAHVLRGVPLLDEAALQAVQQWQFTPTNLNGQPVPVIMTVTVNFTTQ